MTGAEAEDDEGAVDRPPPSPDRRRVAAVGGLIEDGRAREQHDEGSRERTGLQM